MSKVLPMPQYFNDSPIERPSDDRYGIAPFADTIAKSILNIKDPIGTTIAIHGPWGSGKSSTVNLIKTALAVQKRSDLVVSDFKCWWFRGEEALALAFLQNLDGMLKEGLGDKIKDLVPSLTKRLLQAGPVIGTAAAWATGVGPVKDIVSGASKFAETFFSSGDTVEKVFRALTKALAEQSQRFLIIIDDIDRLNPEEAVAIFRLVKSIGRLPNLIYLLVFDRDLAEKAVGNRYPSEGPHFLEKIIQASFELPSPAQSDLNAAVLTAAKEVCGVPAKPEMTRFLNIFHDAVVPYMTTPRHVARFRNAITVTWPAIANEVSRADYMALEVIRLYEPALFKAIRMHKASVCGVRERGGGTNRDDSRFQNFIRDLPAERHHIAKLALKRIFPRLDEMGYGNDWMRVWDSERRVCVEAHFDTYFRLSLSDDALPTNVIEELIQRADEADFIKTAFRKASSTERKSGTSMVPVYLDEFTTHAPRIATDKVRQFVTAMFEVHDEIDLLKDADRGFMGTADTTVRYHWLIRRLTGERFSLQERTDLYLHAIQSAPLGWLVEFAESARDDYREGDSGPTREDDCLVTEAAIEGLTGFALTAIRKAAGDGTLLKHPDLMYILYRWRNFTGNDPAEIRAWTDTQIEDPRAAVILARRMTGQSWSIGLDMSGHLGDRVSTPIVIARIDDDTDIIDVAAFRQALERIAADETADPAERDDVKSFLEAWQNAEKRPRSRR